MERFVESELLDILPPRDKRALRVRRDLKRVNAWMGHPELMADILRENVRGRNSRRVVELGAGDGHFLFSVALRLKEQWPDAEATLVDRLDALDPEIRGQLGGLGWRVRAEVANVSDWLRQAPPDAADAVVANLFLHELQTNQLTEILREAARAAPLFIALEPSRSWLPRLCGHFLWAIGCGPVTRHDARISIRAGFLGRELSALWPEKENWELTERPVGLFSHLFVARRKD